MNLVKVISSEVNKINQRLIKVLRFGKADVQTPIQAAPYGLDSNPIKDMVAVYGKTESDSNTIIIGYLNKSSLANPGEYRTFCTDANGTEKFYTWMKVNGTIEIGGDTNFAVKYTELKTEFDKLKLTVNELIAKYNTHVHVIVNAVPLNPILPVSSTPTPVTQTLNTSVIDNCKNDVIKTIG